MENRNTFIFDKKCLNFDLSNNFQAIKMAIKVRL